MRRSPAPSPHRLIYDAEVHVLIPAHGSTLVPLQQFSVMIGLSQFSNAGRLVSMLKN